MAEPRRGACAEALEPVPPVRVNGVEIGEAAIAAEMQYHPAASREAAYRAAARALVVKALLLQRAQEAFSDEPSVAGDNSADEARIRRLLEREVTVPEADETACRTYFENNPERFRGAALIEASHILLPAAPDDIEGRREALRQAESLLQALADDTAAFERLARLHSACPSAHSGGSLGILTPGQTCDEFERQVFRLPQGLCARPLETRYGYHIVRIDRRLEGDALDYQAVRDRIATYLTERVRRKALAQYIHRLVGEADIDGIDLEGSDSPLMQ